MLERLIAYYLLLLFLLTASLPLCSPSMAKPPSRGASRASGSVYPQFRSNSGTIHWIREQMPLRVHITHGACLDEFIDSAMGAPIVNVDNTSAWPKLVANILAEGKLRSLPTAPGYSQEQYQAAFNGISMWKPFEREGLFTYTITDEDDADIYVFWTNHFVNKMGLALFANDIRGVTSKESFPYRAIMSGGKADFKPAVIILKTTDSNNNGMPFQKTQAAAAHEFGHALGIEGHSTNPGDLMSIYYGSGQISVNDAATIRYLYHLTPDLMP